MKSVITLVITIFSILNFISVHAQKTIPADVILESIDNGKAVTFENAIIRGNLDFSQLETQKRGGSYGVRKGVVKEFIHQVLKPVKFVNCTFEGEVSSYSENRLPGTLKENFTWFYAPVAFESCTFKERVEIERSSIKAQISFTDCQFDDDIRFDRVHFDQTPIFENNMIEGNFTNKRTNWRVQEKDLEMPEPTNVNVVNFKLKNPTWKKINIKFGSNRWTLSPLGTSGLNTVAGQKVYRIEGGQKKLILTVDQSLEGQTIDVSKL